MRKLWCCPCGEIKQGIVGSWRNPVQLDRCCWLTLMKTVVHEEFGYFVAVMLPISVGLQCPLKC